MSLKAFYGIFYVRVSVDLWFTLARSSRQRSLNSVIMSANFPASARACVVSRVLCAICTVHSKNNVFLLRDQFANNGFVFFFQSI